MPTKLPAKPSKVKTLPDFTREAEGIICGCDEAGRGPLAGPVTAACVFIPHEMRTHPVWNNVRDSKKMTAVQRENIFEIIQEQSCFGIASSSVAEIDDINILHASILAMRRATVDMCKNFKLTPDLVLLDGNYKPQFPYPVQPVVKGDMLSVSIAAASILAKVTRDQIMQELHEQHPQYGWLTNAGYGTPIHLKALNEHGSCVHHRRHFAPVKATLTT